MNDTGQLSELRSEIPLGAAMKRGFLGHCPSCGKTPLFKSYLKQVQSCPNCRAEFGHIQADNAALAHHHRGRASIPENDLFGNCYGYVASMLQQIATRSADFVSPPVRCSL